MAELPTYRQHIEQLNNRFPDKEMLTRKDVMAFTGFPQTTARTHYPFPGHFVSKVKFANMLAREDAS